MKSFFLILQLTVIFMSAKVARSQIGSALIVFGDSSVDSGNNNYIETIFKSNFPPYGRDYTNMQPTGRFSDGRIPTDFIASLLGLPNPLPYLDPQAEGSKITQGISFASGGSGYLDSTAKLLNVLSLNQQLYFFKQYKQKLIKIVGSKNASDTISNALFVLSTGSYDYISNYYIEGQKFYSKSQFNELMIQSFKNFVQTIYNEGGRYVGVVSLAPLGCAPAVITIFGGGVLKCVESPNQDALAFNTRLEATTKSISSSHPKLKLAYLDIYKPVLNVTNNPSLFGFKVGLTGCCGVGRLAVSVLCNQFTPYTCANASEYVWWDAAHPSDALNSVLSGDLLTQAIPFFLG